MNIKKKVLDEHLNVTYGISSTKEAPVYSKEEAIPIPVCLRRKALMKERKFQHY